jgi:signal transduction histidine kinase
MEAELAEVQRRLLESVEAERTHLARELHDGPIQDLYSSIFFVQEAGSAVTTPQGNDSLNSARDTIQEAISMLRVICGELRPPALAPFGLEKAIRSHVEQVLETYPDLDIHLDLEEDNQQLPELVRLGLYRIYHQLLTNTIRHAQASKIWVSFALKSDVVVLEVKDNGTGFIPPTRWIDLAREGHLGLVGASERAESLGGTLSIESAPGKGTCVRAMVPRGGRTA